MYRVETAKLDELKNVIGNFFFIKDIYKMTVQINNRWAICATVDEMIAAIVLFFYLVFRALKMTVAPPKGSNKEVADLVDAHIQKERAHNVRRQIIESNAEIQFAMNVWVTVFAFPVDGLYQMATKKKGFWISPNVVAMVDELGYLLPNFNTRKAWMYLTCLAKPEALQTCVDNIILDDRNGTVCEDFRGFKLQQLWTDVKGVVAPVRPHRGIKAAAPTAASVVAAPVVAAPVADSAAAGSAPKRQKKSKPAPVADSAAAPVSDSAAAGSAPKRQKKSKPAPSADKA
jgi:hypothetical protein